MSTLSITEAVVGVLFSLKIFLSFITNCSTFQKLVNVVLVIILSLHIVQVALSIGESIFSYVHWNVTVVALYKLHQSPQSPWRNFEPRGSGSALREMNELSGFII